MRMHNLITAWAAALVLSLSVHAGEIIPELSNIPLPDDGREVVLTVNTEDLPQAGAVTLVRTGDAKTERFLIRAYWTSVTGAQRWQDLAEISMYGVGQRGRFTIDLAPLRNTLRQTGDAPAEITLGMRRVDLAPNTNRVELVALRDMTADMESHLRVESIETLP